MKMLNVTLYGLATLFLLSCGQAIPLNPEGVLGDAVIGDGDGTRTDGSDLGSIFTVYNFSVPDTTGSIPGYVGGDYPFTGALQDFGMVSTDKQWPFFFSFTYPDNNFKLADGRLLIDTSRDSSDTEGIFVDGVFSGFPALANNGSPKIIHAVHGQGGGTGENVYFNDFAVAHYVQNQVNTFDLQIAQLLDPTPITNVDALADGELEVVTGDDSPVFQAFLLFRGFTISKTALTCVDSATQTFQNNYLHDDGNSVGTAAFTGTVETPFESTSSVVPAFKSIEFNFDALLPAVEADNLAMTNVTLNFTVSRNADPTAIVVNGVGVSEAAFNRSSATAEVGEWSDSSTTAWNTFLAGVPTNETPTVVSLDLRALLGTTKILTLLKQGRLNISLAGGFRRVNASNATVNRARGNPVSGPVLDSEGTYFVKLCTVPDNPESPLTDDDPLPAGGTDTTSPAVTSLQASEITANSAVVQWLTDEGATSQVGYGVGDTDTLTADDPTYKTFHSVSLTGLQAFKYYYFRVITRDSNDNETTSSTKVFRTLR